MLPDESSTIPDGLNNWPGPVPFEPNSRSCVPVGLSLITLLGPSVAYMLPLESVVRKWLKDRAGTWGIIREAVSAYARSHDDNINTVNKADNARCTFFTAITTWTIFQELTIKLIYKKLKYLFELFDSNIRNYKC